MNDHVVLAETEHTRVVRTPDNLVLKTVYDKAMFEREQEIAVLLRDRSDCIVSVEYVDAETQTLAFPAAQCDLYEWMHRIDDGTPGSCFKTRVFHDYLCQIIQGLYDLYLYRVEHYDIKPSNILVFADGTARITDFGLAVHQGSAYQKHTGTYAYMAPELVSVQENVDHVPHSMDVYSTSLMILYIMYPSLLLAWKRPLSEKEYERVRERAAYYLFRDRVHRTLTLLLLAGTAPDPSTRISLPLFVQGMQGFLN